jgi:hypothetical protein
VFRSHNLVACLALVCLAGCSADSGTAPRRALGGQVVVRARLSDTDGNDLGPRDARNVFGLRVRLLTDSVPSESTTTVNGAFSFNRIRLGSQRAVALLGGFPVDSTASLLVTAIPATFPDTLVFGVHGDITIRPNPSHGAVQINFQIARDDTVRLTVTTLSGSTVHTLVDQPLVAGVHAVNWDGNSDGGTPVPTGWYLVCAWLKHVPGAPNTARDVGPGPTPGGWDGPFMSTVMIRE